MGGIGQFERAWISLVLWVLVLAEGALLFQGPRGARGNDTGRDPARKPACLQPAAPRAEQPRDRHLSKLHQAGGAQEKHAFRMDERSGKLLKRSNTSVVERELG